MPSPALWAELHQERWVWADQAFSDFRMRLAPELQAHFPDNRREVSVVLYGPSQTGKSTLLLRLLGVQAGAAFAEVERVLRGKRDLGQSVTAVPTRYHWSHHAGHWELAAHPDPPVVVSADRLRDVLADLRRSVESGIDPTGGNPIQIGIPMRFRRPGVDVAWPYILDLPGTNPRDDSERALAIDAARRHIATAHVVIMVTTSDNLTVLRPEVLSREMPPLADWHVAPDRFRVVLTRTASNSSNRTWFESNSRTLDDLRDRTILQLDGVLNSGGSGSPFPRDVLYPVEYGTSWEDLKTKHPTAFHHAKPVVDTAFAELATGLTGRDIDQMRLLTALRARPILAAAAQRTTAALQRSLEDADAKLSRADRHQVLVETRKHAFSQKAQALNERVLHHKYCREQIKGINVHYSALSRPDIKTRTEAEALNQSSRTWFLHAARVAWLRWVKQCDDRGLFSENEDALAFMSLEGLAEGAFDKHVSCCHQCTERLWPPTVWNKDPKDCGRLHAERVPLAASDFTEGMRSHASALLEPVLADLEAELGLTRATAARWAAAALRADRRVRQARTIRSDINERLAAAEERGAVATAQADELAGQLQARWQERARALYLQLGRERDRDRQCYTTIAVLLHLQNRDSLTPEEFHAS